MANQPSSQTIKTPFGTFTVNGGGSTSTNSPLGGLGKNYTPRTIQEYGRMPGTSMLSPSFGAQTTTVLGTTPQSRPYMPGDQWKLPIADQSQVPVLKSELLQAGLLTAKTLNNPGVWDTESADAYARVMDFANAYGMTVRDALNYFVANPKASASKGTREPVVSFANPADVAGEYRSASARLTGQEQDPTQFQDYYRGLEAQAASQRGTAHHAATPGGSGYVDYTRAPSVQGAADQYLLEHDPQDVMSYGIASRMNTFLGMIGSK